MENDKAFEADGIDGKVLWVYHQWWSNEGQDTSPRVEMGKTN